MTLHPNDVELLDTLLTCVSERRINAGQQMELEKRAAQDLKEQGFPYLDSEKRRYAWQCVEEHMKSLKSEMEAIISDEYGYEWRTTS